MSSDISRIMELQKAILGNREFYEQRIEDLTERYQELLKENESLKRRPHQKIGSFSDMTAAEATDFLAALDEAFSKIS